jgi:hypothetical protein
VPNPYQIQRQPTGYSGEPREHPSSPHGKAPDLSSQIKGCFSSVAVKDSNLGRHQPTDYSQSEYRFSVSTSTATIRCARSRPGVNQSSVTHAEHRPSGDSCECQNRRDRLRSPAAWIVAGVSIPDIVGILGVTPAAVRRAQSQALSALPPAATTPTALHQPPGSGWCSCPMFENHPTTAAQEGPLV